MSYMKMLNGAFGTLSAGIDTDDTTIILTGGHGSRFPSLAAGQCFVATLSNKPANKRETVLVTARDGDTLTVIRAFGDSSAKDWASNDRISIRWDRTMAMQYALVGGFSEYLQGGGTADAITATLPTLQTTLIDGMRVFVEITTGANTGNATFTLSFDRTEWGGGVTSGTTKTLSRSFVSATPLEPGDIPGSNFVAELVYSAAIDRWVLANPGFSKLYREGLTNNGATISGGSTASLGARAVMYGESHATRANDFDLIGSSVDARVTEAFRVVDAGDESVAFAVTEDGEVSGDAVATLAEIQANTSGTKLVVAERIVHCPLVPKTVLEFEVAGLGSALDDTITVLSNFSEGSATPSLDVSNNRINITFGNAYANTNFRGVVMVAPTTTTWTSASTTVGRINGLANGRYVVEVYGNKAAS